MKSPPQAQNTNTHPTTLSNSMLQALFSSNAESPFLPSTMTNTSPESQAVQQRRSLLMILDLSIALMDEDDDLILHSAIALIDGDDLNPTKASTTHHWPPQ
jgi:hypothetical protein